METGSRFTKLAVGLLQQQTLVLLASPAMGHVSLLDSQLFNFLGHFKAAQHSTPRACGFRCSKNPVVFRIFWDNNPAVTVLQNYIGNIFVSSLNYFLFRATPPSHQTLATPLDFGSRGHGFDFPLSNCNVTTVGKHVPVIKRYNTVLALCWVRLH